MSDTRQRIVAIGECMIELVEDGPGRMRRSFGGDTLNTAVHLRRSLPPSAWTIAYLTVLGDDPFSDEMLAAWTAENIDVSLVGRLPGRLPGLYAVTTDETGDRSFSYWRTQAPVRDLFRDDASTPHLAATSGAALIYFSGITLAILDPTSRERLFALLDERRATGTRIAFDPNFRSRLWTSHDEAKRWHAKALERVDLALPTFDDEAALWGDGSPEATLERISALGVGETVVKCGMEAAHARAGSEACSLAPSRALRPLDTTGAGDSFNAAYIAARLEGASLQRALKAGHELAGHVVMHRGAIGPRP